MATRSGGIYVHVPFCRQACTYCNFHFSTSLRTKDDVLQAMLREIAIAPAFVGDMQVETIYFGGGTPSLLSASEINMLTEALHRYFKIGTLKEFTLEANPDDLDRNYLRELKQTTVSRLSIGIQSFRDLDLAYMKRVHNASQAESAVKGAQDAGYEELTIDLIYGTPGLADADWQKNLATVKDLSIPHFSAYALTVEERTALHHDIANKRAAPVDPDRAAAQFEILTDLAGEMGYEHYEISNLAIPGHRAVHNSNYWRGLPYAGIGPGAHSFDGVSRRRWNVANNALYARSILASGEVPYEEEQLSADDMLNEYIMTSLRTEEGCDLGYIREKWGEDVLVSIMSEAEHYIAIGQAVRREKRLLLTKAGRLFADGIAAAVFQ